jgi:nucleotide-binding universal stress UspA family protein
MFGNRIVHMRRDATHVDTQALLSSYKMAPGKKAIIVGVDFTDASRRAVEWAVRHFGQAVDAKLIFVHCYSAPKTLIPSLNTTNEQNIQHSDRMMADFEAFMKRVMSSLKPLQPNSTNAPGTTSSMSSQSEKSMEAEMILCEGRPYDELCALAEGVGCDALIVGYSNRTGLRSMMGSTSTSLVSGCHSNAVVVVK